MTYPHDLTNHYLITYLNRCFNEVMIENLTIHQGFLLCSSIHKNCNCKLIYAVLNKSLCSSKNNLNHHLTCTKHIKVSLFSVCESISSANIQPNSCTHTHARTHAHTHTLLYCRWMSCLRFSRLKQNMIDVGYRKNNDILEIAAQCTGRSPVQSIGHARSCRRRVAAYRIEQTWRSQKCKYLP